MHSTYLLCLLVMLAATAFLWLLCVHNIFCQLASPLACLLVALSVRLCVPLSLCFPSVSLSVSLNMPLHTLE